VIGRKFVLIKKILHILRFLALVFLLFFTIVMCFVLNKALDRKIMDSHEETLHNVKTEQPYEEESETEE